MGLPACLSVTLQINIFKEKKRCELNEDHIQVLIREKYRGHVLTTNQVLAMDYHGTAITLQVLSMIDDSKTNNPPYGLITNESRMTVIPDPDNKYLIWVTQHS